MLQPKNMQLLRAAAGCHRRHPAGPHDRGRVRRERLGARPPRHPPAGAGDGPTRGRQQRLSRSWSTTRYCTSSTVTPALPRGVSSCVPRCNASRRSASAVVATLAKPRCAHRARRGAVGRVRVSQSRCQPQQPRQRRHLAIHPDHRAGLRAARGRAARSSASIPRCSPTPQARMLRAEQLRFADWQLALMAFNVGSQRPAGRHRRSPARRDAWSLIRAGRRKAIPGARACGGAHRRQSPRGEAMSSHAAIRMLYCAASMMLAPRSVEHARERSTLGRSKTSRCRRIRRRHRGIDISTPATAFRAFATGVAALRDTSRHCGEHLSIRFPDGKFDAVLQSRRHHRRPDDAAKPSSLGRIAPAPDGRKPTLHFELKFGVTRRWILSRTCRALLNE